MANFQATVNAAPARGIPGGTASINPILSAPYNYQAAENVEIGRFVFDNGDGTVSGTGASGATPLGFAHLDRIYTMTDVTADASLAIAAGATVEVVTGGDFYATADEAVTAGADVCVDPTTGKYAAAGSKTGFKWATAAAAGEVAVITTNYCG